MPFDVRENAPVTVDVSNRTWPSRLWLMCFTVGGAGAALSWSAFPHDREKGTLLQYLVFIAVFMTLLAGIAIFPNRNRTLYLLLLAPVLLFNLYLAPRLTFYAEFDEYHRFYTLFFMVLYPLLLASVCLAYRLGGGSPGRTLKIGIVGVLVLFSGIMDMMWFIWAGLDYATHATSIPHVEVFLGRVPSLPGMWAFIGVHFLAAIAVLRMPIDQVLERRLPGLSVDPPLRQGAVDD
jgi:hypothetical protein